METQTPQVAAEIIETAVNADLAATSDTARQLRRNLVITPEGGLQWNP